VCQGIPCRSTLVCAGFNGGRIPGPLIKMRVYTPSLHNEESRLSWWRRLVLEVGGLHYPQNAPQSYSASGFCRMELCTILL